MTDDNKPPADTKPPITLEAVFGRQKPGGGWDSALYRELGADRIAQLLREAPPTSTEAPPTSTDEPATPSDYAGYWAVREKLVAEHEARRAQSDPRRSDSPRWHRKK